MLRKIRIILATVFFAGITLLFLDFTGTIHCLTGWMAKIQFLPAVLALNVVVIVFLILLTLICGRVYCSVICPLGIMQDIIAWFGKKAKKNRYAYSAAKNWLRYGMLAVFVAALVAGASSIVSLLAPYSAFGRIASNLLAPVYGWCNNLLAWGAEQADSLAFYRTEVSTGGTLMVAVAAVTLVLLFILAWRNGRTYCNTICPVGTVLGFLSRWSWLKPVIDTSKCVNCRLCERNCKSACINTAEHSIDYSRCVACMDCINKCHSGAISYKHCAKPAAKKEAAGKEENVDNGRRAFMTTAAALTATAALKAQKQKVDGGLAVIEDKKIPERKRHIVPAGALSAKNLAQHCTSCQLCVSACPNDVLRPSTDLMRLMQPEMSYERGYCRPECTRCSNVCPTGAIRPITVEDKTAIQIGRAVWIKKNCLPAIDGTACNNCAHHCPTGAIQMVPSDPENEDSPKIPAINEAKCIGCGACENLCPSRPYSAIYVEGFERHGEI
ncbi:MAG: 4Fe-4S binding protein [Prevotella sp.]|nr:4Fe-4S binding protein [Prevotella sp.]